MPYKNPDYRHYRQQSPDLFIQSSYQTVPLKNADYNGKKFAWFMKYGNALAVIGIKKENKSKRGPRCGRVRTIQSILIPLDEVKHVK